MGIYPGSARETSVPHGGTPTGLKARGHRELLVGEERMRSADTGVADHDVETAEFLDRARDHRRDLARVADVGALRERADAARGDAFARPPPPGPSTDRWRSA